MGRCISKVNKDHFFAFEEFMKNDILLSNRMTRFGLDMVTRKIYTGIHSIRQIPEKITLAPLQTGVWWRDP